MFARQMNGLPFAVRVKYAACSAWLAMVGISQGQESTGRREACWLALVGEALEARKPMSGSGVKQSHKGVLGSTR